ncbi:HD family phosphohydrolase [Fervidicella metallireducens AeB]|uniref:HD family phosphohydrolase n=1 Tax=Fervidicella metallireducens AeB TaxID=1403537 RepID=A0A017RU76_9CLOT|nr:HD-GYP domain-containing protein [Fervidicella metallireducens]EYE88146.1 HD family phosphohydrolase [Fervidicella metallireducens AeB]
MRYIRIEDSKNGDILARPIVTSDGIVLLSEGTVLSSSYIDKIISTGIKKIFIKDNLYSQTSVDIEDFSQLKDKSINLVSNIYNKVINSETIDSEEIETVVVDILNYVKSSTAFPSKLLETIKLKDNYTYIHSINTCFLSIILGEYFNLSETEQIILGTGALLHDIGKTYIDEKILKKASKLTDDEFKLIQKHTLYGFKILNSTKGIDHASMLIALNHHEKYDGSGYPRGLKGKQIDFFSQLVTICDVYDALINVRSYKKAFKPNETYEYILSKSGTFFNTELVNAFRNCICIYPDGVGVRLSDGRLAFVLHQNKGFPERPVINIITDNTGNFTSPTTVDLMNSLNIVIDDILI